MAQFLYSTYVAMVTSFLHVQTFIDSHAGRARAARFVAVKTFRGPFYNSSEHISARS